jgi:hypothetical protein
LWAIYDVKGGLAVDAGGRVAARDRSVCLKVLPRAIPRRRPARGPPPSPSPCGRP